MNFKIWFLNEVTQDLVNKVLQDTKEKDKPFPDIFGEKDRIVIPYTPDESTSLENKILAKLRNIGEIDLDKGIIKIDKRDYKLGRFILQSQQDNKTKKVVLQKPSENTKPYFADEEIKWWNTYGDPIKVLKVYDEKEKYAVIVSRNVVDVLRMSDHDNWTSCHAPTGNFFHCAIAEAKNAGGLAYVVKKEDLKNVDLNKHEIFKDKDRKIEGATPIARLRLRLFKNKDDGHHLAMPEDRVYGLKLDGLQDTIRKWAYESQEDKLSHRPRLKEYELMGGSYQDTGASYLFNKFFGDDLDKGAAEYGGEEEDDLHELYEREVEEILDEFKDLNLFSFNASVEDSDGHPYVHYSAYFGITFPNVKLKKEFSNSDREKIKNWGYEYDIFVINEITLQQHQDGLFFGLDLYDEEGQANPDSFREFCTQLSNAEKDAEYIKNSLFHLLMQLGYAEENKAFQTLSQIQQEDQHILNNLSNFEIYKDITSKGSLKTFSVDTKKPINLYNINIEKNNLTEKGLEIFEKSLGYSFISKFLNSEEVKKAFSPSFEHIVNDYTKNSLFNFLLQIFKSQPIEKQVSEQELQNIIYNFFEFNLVKNQLTKDIQIGVNIVVEIKSHLPDINVEHIIETLILMDRHYNEVTTAIQNQIHKIADTFFKTIFKRI